MSEVVKYSIETFESIKQIGKKGREFWFARDLQEVLGYSKWENFEKVIKKAQKACIESDIDITQHFIGMLKTVGAGKGAKREVHDMALSRYACYLIVQNADSSKKIIAMAQTYFAIMTRTQELTQEAYDDLEDKRRIKARKELTEHNKSLMQAAKSAGIADFDFAIFNNAGYEGLYGGLGQKEIHERKNLKKSQKILDYMGSTELAANLFRATQTDDKIRREQIKGKQNAINTHHDVGKEVRDTIKRLGGTMPENLPTPELSVKQLERKHEKLLLQENFDKDVAEFGNVEV